MPYLGGFLIDFLVNLDRTKSCENCEGSIDDIGLYTFHSETGIRLKIDFT